MTAQAADLQTAKTFANDESNTALPLRSDTFLGVCEAIGQDLGINPNWIRLLFAPVILISPLAAIGAYLGLGGAVAASRWLFPANASPAPVAAASLEEEETEERLAA